MSQGERHRPIQAADALRSGLADTAPLALSATDPLTFHGITLPDQRIALVAGLIIQVE